MARVSSHMLSVVLATAAMTAVHCAKSPPPHAPPPSSPAPAPLAPSTCSVILGPQGYSLGGSICGCLPGYTLPTPANTNSICVSTDAGASVISTQQCQGVFGPDSAGVVNQNACKCTNGFSLPPMDEANKHSGCDVAPPPGPIASPTVSIAPAAGFSPI